MTKFLNISVDNTLGGNSPSDEIVSSQKALKTYIDLHSSGSPSWGSITGTLSNQTDLQTALNAKQDEATAVNYDNISNCITEIPQDIKLELNNGTVTLKAGSKVYVPNGFEQDGTTLKFDVVTVPSDIVFHSGTIGSSTMDMVLTCNLVGGFGTRANASFYESGSEQPSDTTHYWYDTVNNAVKKYDNGSWVRAYSFPIGIYERTNGVATAIKQVFNGFGYIGSTIFALPGVKGLIPNGRNADGILKNTEFTTTTVLTIQRNINGEDAPLALNGSNIGNYASIEYNERENLNISSGNNIPRAIVGKWSASNGGKITSLTPKTPFHAVDYNDFSDLKDVVNTKLQGYQTIANLVTSVSSSSTDSQYPSAKLFYDTCGDIETLINAL